MVAELASDRFGRRRVNDVLLELSKAGIVLRDHRPPAYLYRLNRDHVAAGGIILLADMWTTLVQRIRDALADWELPALAACLFGSAARGEATSESDIDVLLVRPDAPDATPHDLEARWHGQVDRLTERVQAWSGNACEVLELSVAELRDAYVRQDRLALDLQRDAIALAGRDIRTLMRAKAAR
jgi:predicted nucleotidyltransferase